MYNCYSVDLTYGEEYVADDKYVSDGTDIGRVIDG